MVRSYYSPDPKLLPRVREYISHRHKTSTRTFIHPDEIVHWLKKQYRVQYGRMSEKALLTAVERALPLALQAERTTSELAKKDGTTKEVVNLDSDSDNSEDDDIGSGTELIESKTFNLMNESLQHVYNATRPPPSSPSQSTTTTTTSAITSSTISTTNAPSPSTAAPTTALDTSTETHVSNSSNSINTPSNTNATSTPSRKRTAPPTPTDNTSAAPPRKKRAVMNGRTPSGKTTIAASHFGNSSEAMPSGGSTAPAIESFVPSVRFADVAGIEACIQEIRELIEWPLARPEIYRHLGVTPPRGVLLHGPPGVGKTLLAHAIAGELNLPLFAVSAPALVGGLSGESEGRIRELFAAAAASAPCIIFIDEIDAVAPKKDAAGSRSMERRIVAQLSECIDELQMAADKAKEQGLEPKHVIVIGATNRPDAIDSNLRRTGRFDREILLGIPDEAARAKILEVLSRKLKLDTTIDFREVARRTPGYVGADLAALTREAAACAVRRIFSCLKPELNDTAFRDHPISDDQMTQFAIGQSDFLQAVGRVQPSAKREGFSTLPDVTWADVGALGDIRKELMMAIVNPIRHPERWASVGLDAPSGVLLYGPPGCGKTLLAKAVANACGANFISIKGPELLNKYVGESERAVRQVFQRGQASAPCVIFFDEIDALCPRRDGSQSGNAASERVVNMLLTELDGIDRRRGVFVIAATNRPDILDPAMLRPGRLGKLLYVPLPTPDARVDILRTICRKHPLAPDVDLDALGRDPRTARFSGADLSALVREACTVALSEAMDAEERGQSPAGPVMVRRAHFEYAFTQVFPSVSERDEKEYNRRRTRLVAARLAASATAVDMRDAEGEKTARREATPTTAIEPAPAVLPALMFPHQDLVPTSQ